MHPYGAGAPLSFYRWHRGPSRIIWFLIGAASATWWIKGKEARHGQGSWSYGHCVRPSIQPQLQPLPAPPNPDASSWSPRDIPRAINNIPPADSWGGQQSQTEPWSEEKERMAALGNQAGDKVSNRIA